MTRECRTSATIVAMTLVGAAALGAPASAMVSNIRGRQLVLGASTYSEEVTGECKLFTIVPALEVS